MKFIEFLKLLPVRSVETIKRFTGLKTWHIESFFVFACLMAVAIPRLVITHHGWEELLGVVAVWATFSHASVANRLEEKERKRFEKTGKAEVECYKYLDHYFYLKEITWFAYFILIGAYSALIGVIIFLMYGPWRRLWRKYHPV